MFFRQIVQHKTRPILGAANVQSASRQRAAISGTSCRRRYLPGRRALRSASTSRLVALPIKMSTVGSRAFPVLHAQV